MRKTTLKRPLLRVLSLAVIIVMCFALALSASAGSLYEKTAQSENTEALASLAKSQIGSNQFRVWYKDELPEGGDWSAVLVTSCLSGSEVWKTDYYSSNSQDMYDKMDEAGIVSSADSYEPYPGDIAFYYDNGELRSGVVAGMYSDGTVSIVSADDEGSSVAVMTNYKDGVKGYAAVPDEWFGTESGTDDASNDPADPSASPSPSEKPKDDPKVSPSAAPSDAPDASDAPSAAPSEAPADDPGSSLISGGDTVWYVCGGVGAAAIIAIIAGVARKKAKVKKAYSSLFDDIK